MSFFQANVWLDTGRTNKLTTTPITVVSSVSRDLQLNQAWQHTLNMALSDPLTRSIEDGMYVELTIGGSSGRRLHSNGMVANVSKSNDGSGLSVTLNSPLYALNFTNNLGEFVTALPVYRDVDDVLNGAHKAGEPSYPGNKGVFDGSGWYGVWTAGPNLPQTPIDTMGKGRGDWGSVYQNYQSVLEIYGLFGRERMGSTPLNGVVDYGPLGDPVPNGFTIYGEDKLAAKLGQEAGSLPDLWEAQKRGLPIISAATYQAERSHVKNLIWCLGGNTDNMVTIRHAYGDIFEADGTTLAAGVQRWQPNKGHGGQMYYVKPNSRQTWRGHTYELVAAQQWNKEFAYGVVDRTSAAKYGVIEVHHRWPKATDPELLLAFGLGYLTKASNPPPSWQFGVRHPWNGYSGALFQEVFPGQTVEVQYEGAVHQAMTWNPDTQRMEGQGDFVTMTFPNTTDPEAIRDVKRVVHITDTLDASGYQATYEMGHTIPDSRHQFMLMDLARKFEDHRTTPTKHHSFVQGKLDGIMFLYSRNPNAKERHDVGDVEMDPGSTMVSDVPDERFFGDNTEVRYRLQLQDEASCVDFWLGKPTGPTMEKTDISGAVVKRLKPGEKPVYGLLRICGPRYTGNGNKCGFYTTTDGQTFNYHGSLPHKNVLDSNQRMPLGTMDLRIHWSGDQRVAFASIQMPDGTVQHVILATWNDKKKLISTWGAIGWHHHISSVVDSPALVSAVHMHPYHKGSTATTGGDGRGGHATVTSGNHGGTTLRHGDNPDDDPWFVQQTDKFGNTWAKGSHTHGPFPQHTTTVGSTVTASGQTTVTFTGTMQKNALLLGMTVYDPNKNSAVVSDIKRDKSGAIQGFISRDPGAAKMLVGTTVFWDPMDLTDATGQGHKRTAIYAESHGGWGIADIPAEGEKAGLVAWPDGSVATLKGAKPLTDAEGNVISIKDLAVTGAKLAKGIEREGAALFDAGEIDSATQVVYVYPAPPGGNPLYTPQTTINGDATGLWDQTQGPTAAAASWVSQTADGKAGRADAILQLTAGTYGGQTYNTVRWFDTQLVEYDGFTRVYTVRHNSSFTFPIYLDIGSNPTGLRMGAQARITAITGSTVTLDRSVSVPGGGGNVQTNVGDTWIVGVGGNHAETGTIASIDSTNRAVIITGLGANHEVGERLYLRTTFDPSSGQQVPVQSGMLLDGSVRSDHVQTAIDAIAVGFYALDIKSNTFNWYRGYWGTAAFSALSPYAGGGTLAHLGQIPGQPGDWLELLCKADQLKAYIPNTISSVGATGQRTVTLGIPITDGTYKIDKLIAVDTGSNRETVRITAISGSLNNVTGFTAVFTRTHAANSSVYPVNGSPLYATGTHGTKVIKGVEVAVYSASPGAGQTCYFDAHEHGASVTRGKATAGSAGGNTIVKGAVGNPQRDPTTSADGTHHSNLTFWVDAGKQVHWESGALVTHDNRTWPIVGGDEDTPNIGISGLVPGQSSAAGNWLVFNSNQANISLKDPLGPTVVVPGYLPGAEFVITTAVGATGSATVALQTPVTNGAIALGQPVRVDNDVDAETVTVLAITGPTNNVSGFTAVFTKVHQANVNGYIQTRGFAVLSKAYDFTARTGGGTIKRGTPKGIFKIGAIHQAPDKYTGELPLGNPQGSGKQGGSKTRTGSQGRDKLHQHNYTKHQHHGIRYQIRNSKKTAQTCTLAWTLTPGLAEGQAIADDNTVLWRVKRSGAAAGQTPPQVLQGQLTGCKPGDFIVFDVTTGSAGYKRFASGAWDPNAKKNIGKYVIGRISPQMAKGSANYYLQTHNLGSSEVPADSVAPGAATRRSLSRHTGVRNIRVKPANDTTTGKERGHLMTVR